MHGKWVTLDFGLDVECKVWVACLPDTPDDVLQRLALNNLRSKLPQKKSKIAAGMEAISIISDYEYSQGYGVRYEMEQELKNWIEELNKSAEPTAT